MCNPIKYWLFGDIYSSKFMSIWLVRTTLILFPPFALHLVGKSSSRPLMNAYHDQHRPKLIGLGRWFSFSCWGVQFPRWTSRKTPPGKRLPWRSLENPPIEDERRWGIFLRDRHGAVFGFATSSSITDPIQHTLGGSSHDVTAIRG